jgi:hypothetical protein
MDQYRLSIPMEITAGRGDDRPSFIVIWGVSGAGKSQYCKWLAQRGYIYLDNDTIAQRMAEGTANALERRWMSTHVGETAPEDFARSIASQRVVVEFGARPDESALALLRRLINLRASAWWFDGDRTAALESWLDRDVPVPAEYWYIQTKAVEAAWPRIAETLRSKIVRTIGPGRAYLSEMQVDRLMFGHQSDQVEAEAI